MDNCYFDVYYFFTPMRIVWDHTKQFFGENDSKPWTQNTEYKIPKIRIQGSENAKIDQKIPHEESIADYFGIPINLTTEKLTKATDYCGVRSGENVDKWKECRLTQGKASSLEFAPIIEESPVNIECKVKKMEELGSHHMFLAEVTAVQVDDSYMDDNGKFMLNNTGLIAYSHGEYLSLGEKLGQFGYSVRKKKKQTKKKSGMK